MIDIESYTCAVCGAIAQVEGFISPKITRSCSHDGSIIHANLRGTVYGEGALHTVRLTKDQIPANQLEAFLNSKWGKTGKVLGKKNKEQQTWALRDWYGFVQDQHVKAVREELEKLKDTLPNTTIKLIQDYLEKVDGEE